MRLFLCDDNEQYRALTRLVMEDAHEIVGEAGNGIEVIEQAPATDPDVVLLDLNMPRMDGREALRAIKSDPELRQIPVVVMTTSQAEADVFASYDIGASSYIVKPITFDALIDVLRQFERYWFRLVELPAGRGGTP